MGRRPVSLKTRGADGHPQCPADCSYTGSRNLDALSAELLQLWYNCLLLLLKRTGLQVGAVLLSLCVYLAMHLEYCGC